MIICTVFKSKKLLVLFFVVFFLTIISCEDNKGEPVIENNDFVSGIVKDSLEKNKKYNDLFLDMYKNYGFTGCVLVSQKGKVIFENYYGYSNIRNKDTLSLDKQFQLASVSKQFTALAILQLYEKGKLSLQDTIQKFFPNFPYHDITVHMLLSHRSGLPNYIYFYDKLYHDDYNPISNSQVLDSLIAYNPQWYYPPNKKFNYSNTGYMVLASIVEKLSGLSFANYMHKNVFGPLEMSNTLVYDKNIVDNIPNKATGYLYGKREAEDNFLNGVVGDKGVFSTVSDLYKWETGLYTGKIINKDTLNLAFKPHGRKLERKTNYGYGWRMYNLKNNEQVLFHAGWWQGFQSLIIRLEQDSSSIIILKNRKNRYVFNHNDFFKILYPNDTLKRR